MYRAFFVLSVDTFVYTGSLDFFEDIVRIVSLGGIILLSTEHLEEASIILALKTAIEPEVNMAERCLC
jgi:hypothetical protein